MQQLRHESAILWQQHEDELTHCRAELGALQNHISKLEAPEHTKAEPGEHAELAHAKLNGNGADHRVDLRVEAVGCKVPRIITHTKSQVADVGPSEGTENEADDVGDLSELNNLYSYCVEEALNAPTFWKLIAALVPLFLLIPCQCMYAFGFYDSSRLITYLGNKVPWKE